MAHPMKQRGKSTSKEASRSGHPSTPSSLRSSAFCFGKSDAEEGGSSQPFPIK
jgi:hypothetical protein